MVSWLVAIVSTPSTWTATCPCVGDGPPVPGGVRLKSDTTKITETGVPFPMTEWSAGETIVRVGTAARTPGAESPSTKARRAQTRTSTAARMLKVVRPEGSIAHSSAFLSRDEPASILNLGVMRCGRSYPHSRYLGQGLRSKPHLTRLCMS